MELYKNLYEQMTRHFSSAFQSRIQVEHMCVQMLSSFYATSSIKSTFKNAFYWLLCHPLTLHFLCDVTRVQKFVLHIRPGVPHFFQTAFECFFPVDFRLFHFLQKKRKCKLPNF